MLLNVWKIWLQGLLNHMVLDEVEELEGMYKQAFDRIMNQVSMQQSTIVDNHNMTNGAAHIPVGMHILQR